jgi:hypothetical protein
MTARASQVSSSNSFVDLAARIRAQHEATATPLKRRQWRCN